MSKHVIFIAIKLKLGLQRHSKLDEASAYNSKKSFKWCIIIDIESGPKTGKNPKNGLLDIKQYLYIPII